MTPKSYETKICPSKNNLKKEKQPTESKNKFANHMSDRRLIPRIYRYNIYFI